MVVPFTKTSPPNQISYCVGKKLGEKAIWKFVDEEKPAYSVTNFCPPLLWGPLLQHVPDTKSLNLSSNVVWAVMTSANSESGKVPQTLFPAYVRILSPALKSYIHS